jgi:chromosome segregation ATPase
MELLLPVILFILTLIIIFSLRAEDKGNHRWELINQRLHTFSKNLMTVQSQFKETAQQTEEKINSKVQEANQMVATLDSQIADLQSRGDDLSKLQEVMNNYKEVLTQLGITTERAEQRIVQVKGEISRIEHVQESLDAFDGRIASFKTELGNTFSETNVTVGRFREDLAVLQEDSLQKLQSYKDEVQEIENKDQALFVSYSKALKAEEEASLAKIDELTETCKRIKEEEELALGVFKGQLASERSQIFEDMEKYSNSFEQLKTQIDQAFVEYTQKVGKLEQDTEGRVAISLEDFRQDCTLQMEKIFQDSVVRTDTAFRSMMVLVRQFLDELTNRMEKAEKIFPGMGEKDPIVSELREIQEGLIPEEESKPLPFESPEAISEVQDLTTLEDLEQNTEKQDSLSWVEFVPQGDEEVINLDEEEEKNT